MHTTTRSNGLAFAISLALVVPTVAGDWLQWGGATRDFRADAGKLSTEWPAGGPKQLWKLEFGDGYSSILVEGETLYTMLRRDDQELVVALDANTGESRWEYAYDAPLPEELDKNFGTGPRATPLIVGDRLFAVGITGKLHCVEKDSGKVVWSHDLLDEYGGNLPRWGYASSPLAYGETILLPVGGTDRVALAFRQSDGEVVWSIPGEIKNSYNSFVLIDVDDQTQAVTMMADQVIGVDPATGRLLWEFPHKTMYEINASLPVWGAGNELFVSSAYGAGSQLVTLTRDGDATSVVEVWSDRKIGLHHSTALRDGATIYCSSGMGRGDQLMAIEAATGATRWKERFGKATIVDADGKFILLSEDGTLAIATATPEKLEIHAKVEGILKQPAWTAPTVVGNRLYVRDREVILALELP